MGEIMVLFGNNGVGKTRYLKQEIKNNVLNNKIVVSNLKVKNNLSVDMNKVYEMNNGLVPYGEYCSDEWKKYCEDENLNKILSYILSKGDVLILDEIDSILPYQDVINICNILKDVSEYWEKIIITGHTDDMLTVRDDLQFYFLDKTGMYILKGSDINEYIDKI